VYHALTKNGAEATVAAAGEELLETAEAAMGVECKDYDTGTWVLPMRYSDGVLCSFLPKFALLVAYSPLTTVVCALASYLSPAQPCTSPGWRRS
jgi:hypothetical protein